MYRPVETYNHSATPPTPDEVAPGLHAPALADLLPEQLDAIIEQAEILVATSPDGESRNAEMGIALLRAMGSDESSFEAELDKRGYWFPEGLLPSVRESVGEWVGTHLIGKELGARATSEKSPHPAAPACVKAPRKPPVRSPRKPRPPKNVPANRLQEQPPDDEDENALWEEAKQQILWGEVDNTADLNLLILYMNQAAREPLLDRPQEIELAQRIEAGLFAYEKLYVTEDASLALRERHDLQALVNDGKAARQRLIEANLRWVISRAVRKQHKGLALLDLIQEGNIGLMHAIEMFDYTKGYKLSIYSKHWIDREMDKALEKTARVIRIPRWQIDQWEVVQTTQRELKAELQREPTMAELAKKTDIDEKSLLTMMVHFRSTLSLDQPVDSDDDDAVLTIGDTVVDRTPDIVDQIAPMAPLEYERLSAVLEEKELQVLHYTTGLNPLTVSGIARELGLNVWQVLLLRDRAYAKLQHPSVRLREYLDVRQSNAVTEEWRDEAPCRDDGPRAFFTSGRGGSQKRPERCSDCQLATFCLQYAVDRDIVYGYWGGLSTVTRKAQRKTA